MAVHPNSLKNLEKGKFKKGQVANPRGGAANLYHVPALKKYTIDTLLDTLNSLMSMTIAELEEVIANPKSTALMVVVARSFIRDKSKGDLLNLERILDRIFGKPKQDMTLSGSMVNTDLNIDVKALSAAKAKKLYDLLREADNGKKAN